MMWRAAQTFAAIGAVIMVVAVAYGFAAGGGWDEVRELAAMPWGLVSLIDVYVGFAIVSGWVIYREVNARRWVPWVVAIMLGGNAVCCAYVLIALTSASGSTEKLWYGRRRVAASD